MLIPPFSRLDKIAIRDRWLTLFNELTGQHDVVSMWIDALCSVMRSRGDIVLPAELLRRERAIIEIGAGPDLAEHLAAILRVDNDGDVGYLLLATGEQRLKAVEATEDVLQTRSKQSPAS